jgi:hypothetical protein
MIIFGRYVYVIYTNYMERRPFIHLIELYQIQEENVSVSKLVQLLKCQVFLPDLVLWFATTRHLLYWKCSTSRKRKSRKLGNFYKIGSWILAQLLSRELTALKGLCKERTVNNYNACTNKGYRFLMWEEFTSVTCLRPYLMITGWSFPSNKVHSSPTSDKVNNIWIFTFFTNFNLRFHLILFSFSNPNSIISVPNLNLC